MSFVKHIRIYRQLLCLMELKTTGTPKVLAEKIGVSERQVYHYLNDMKTLGYKIEYCFEQFSYIIVNADKTAPNKACSQCLEQKVVGLL